MTLLGIRALSAIGMIAAPVYIVLGLVAIGLAVGGGGGSPTSYQGQAGAAAMSFGAAVTLVLGAAGVVPAVAGIWSYFEQWLNLLGVIVPPIGAVVILDQLVLPRFGLGPQNRRARRHRPAFTAWAGGAVAALLTHQFAPRLSDAVIGFAAAAIVFTFCATLTARRDKELTA